MKQIKRIELEEKRIRDSHYALGVVSTKSKEAEIKALFDGYSVDPVSMQDWIEKHRDLL
jgi:hypothetical protein